MKIDPILAGFQTTWILLALRVSFVTDSVLTHVELTETFLYFIKCLLQGVSNVIVQSFGLICYCCNRIKMII